MGKHKKKAVRPASSDAPADRGSAPLPDRARDIWLAGLGAFARARKQGAEGFDALVARGEAVRHEAGETVEVLLARLDAAREEAMRTAKKAAKRSKDVLDAPAEAVEARVEEAVRKAMKKAGLPRRDEVEALTAQVRVLEARLARLQDGAAGPTVFRIASHDGGWTVERDGRAESRHGTKKQALVAGRRLARAHAPSRLVVLLADGTEAETVEYGK